MKVKVVKNHPGEGKFPTFAKGSEVKITDEGCTHFLNWYACEIEGYATYIPDVFVADGKLVRDYNPTELICEAGEILEVKEILYAWFIAVKADGIMGWIPAEVCVSVGE